MCSEKDTKAEQAPDKSQTACRVVELLFQVDIDLHRVVPVEVVWVAVGVEMLEPVVSQ